MDALRELKERWGYDAFRPLQGEAVASALAGRDALVVLPTGGGKSLVYQVPAACGLPTLVVSPLIALMDDQVHGAEQAGLRVGALHSHVPPAKAQAVRSALSSGRLDLLYLSPERLCQGDLVAGLARRFRVIAVDEAHCVSHWGHDFRPEYRQLSSVFDRFDDAVRLALTATATPSVQDDIVAQLGLRTPDRHIGHVDRPNLTYRSLPRTDRRRQILDVIARHPDEGGIVYAQTRKETEEIAASLKGDRIDARAYHAGIDAAVRARITSDFVAERLPVVVATIAFGMGIDRSNVRYVVHANAPKSIEHYQQEAGRAGRDGEPAECVLLFSGGDLHQHRRLATMDGPLSPERALVLDRALAAVARYATAPVCRHRLLTEHFSQEYVAQDDGCGACDVCLGETRDLGAAESLVTAQKILSAVWRFGRPYGAAHLADVMTGNATEKAIRAGHDQLKLFGLLKDAGIPSVRTWTDQLIAQGCLEVLDHDGFPLLGLSEHGRAVCLGKAEVRLGLAVSGKERKARTRQDRAAKAAPTGLDAAATERFTRLRALRKEIAERDAVPPYVVFSDATLRGIAAANPANAEALLEVKGIGQAKLARYGRAVLATLGASAPESSASGDDEDVNTNDLFGDDS